MPKSSNSNSLKQQQQQAASSVLSVISMICQPDAYSEKLVDNCRLCLHEIELYVDIYV